MASPHGPRLMGLVGRGQAIAGRRRRRRWTPKIGPVATEGALAAEVFEDERRRGRAGSAMPPFRGRGQKAPSPRESRSNLIRFARPVGWCGFER